MFKSVASSSQQGHITGSVEDSITNNTARAYGPYGYVGGANVIKTTFDMEAIELANEKLRRSVDRIRLRKHGVKLRPLSKRFSELMDCAMKRYLEMPGTPEEIVAIEDRFLVTIHPLEHEKIRKCIWCSALVPLKYDFKLDNLRFRETVSFDSLAEHKMRNHRFFSEHDSRVEPLILAYLIEMKEVNRIDPQEEIVYPPCESFLPTQQGQD